MVSHGSPSQGRELTNMGDKSFKSASYEYVTEYVTSARVEEEMDWSL